jgi:hypothetical protein
MNAALGGAATAGFVAPGSYFLIAYYDHSTLG